MELFEQFLREYGPLAGLCAVFLFLAGFLLGRFLVMPALRKEKKHAENLMQLCRTAEASKQKLEEQLLEKEQQLVEREKRLQSKEQLAAVWEGEAKGCEEKLSQLETQWKELQKQHQNQEQHLLDLLRQVEDRNTRLQELEAQREALREENKQLVSQLSTEQIALEQIAQMQSTLNAALQRLSELESKLPASQSSFPPVAVETETFVPEGNGEELLKEKLDPSAKELLPEDDTERAKAWIKRAVGEHLPEAKGQDDLTRIEGIGPFIEDQLYALGLCTFEQIAALDDKAIDLLTKAIRFIPGRIKKDRWVEQAAALMKTKAGKEKKKKKKKSAKRASQTPTDDLKLIEGIGPKIEEVLNKAGIKTWKQLAEQSVDNLRKILASAGKRFTLHKPDSWPQQARLAAEAKWKELKALQDEL